MDFKAELAIIEKYVEIKDSGDGEPLIVELITKHFLPQDRFEEARSWRNAIKTKTLKSEMDLAIKSALKAAKTTPVSRMPQNEDWIEMDVSTAAVASDDQQYHYDRTLAYSNAAQSMLDDVEDVRDCRNEYITFFLQGAYEGGLGKKGAHLDTLAMALSDYIEFILLPDKFIELAGEESETLPVTSMETAYQKRPGMVDYLKAHAPGVLSEPYLMNFNCQISLNGKSEEIIITESYVLFVPEKKSGWGAGEMGSLNREIVTAISVGTEFHTEYQGISSTSDMYWTLTFVTSQHTEYKRWLFLGGNEKQMNINRPIHSSTLDRLGEFFDLVEGDSFESSSGYTTSFGVGFWD